MKIYGKNWFHLFIVLGVLLSGIPAAQAQNVTFKLINPAGENITGQVQGAKKWESLGDWKPSPYTANIQSLPTILTVRGKFEGLYGSGLTSSIFDVGSIDRVAVGDSVVVDGVTGVELSRQKSFDSLLTYVNIVFNAVKPTFGTVGINGNDLAGGEIILPTFNQTHPAPFTPNGFVLHNHSLSLRGRVGANTTNTKVVQVKSNTLQRIDTSQASLPVTSTPSTGARIDFQFGVFVLPVQTVNGAGASIPGEIKISSGSFQPSPVTLTNQLPGTQVAVQARIAGTTSATKVVTLDPNTTYNIDWNGTVTSQTTPGNAKVNVVYQLVSYEVVVTDLSGNPIIDLDGTTVRGQVFVQNETTAFVPTGYTSSTPNGNSVGVRGRFDDLTTAFVSAQVKSGHTTVVSAIDAVASPPVSTPGKTRIEIRFKSMVFNTEIVNSLGENLDEGLIRIVNITDVGGQPGFVNSPFEALIRAGRLLNIEVNYATYQSQFDIPSVGGTIYLIDQNGDVSGTETTDPDKGGARATIDAAPVTIRTTNGTDPVAGQIKLSSNPFVNSPITSLPALDGDVLNIEAKYLGFEMDNVEVTVKAGVTQTVNAASGLITEQQNGITAIDIVFSEMTVNVLATDLNGNPILGINGTTVLGQVFVNGKTPSFVPSGYTFQAVSGQLFGFRGRFDDLSSEFQGIQVNKGKTVPINVAANTVGTPFNSPDGSTRVELRFDPVVFTTDVINDLGENLSIATVRLVGITDVGGQPTFVNSPFLAVLRNGRLLNVEVEYGLFQTQFNLNVVGASIQKYDINGNATGTSPAPAGEGGARTIVDDATVVVQTVQTGVPAAGQLNIDLYTTLFQGSPVTINAIVDGTPIKIQAKLNGVTMSSVTVNVTEDHTIVVNALNRTVGAPISTPGTTLINIDFAPNIAPVADAGDDQVLEATGVLTTVTLDGSGSEDADGDELTYAWSWGTSGSAQGVNPQIALPVGETVVTLTVSDGDKSHSDDVLITIQDTTAPQITAITEDFVIPCTHEGQSVDLSVTATDLVTPADQLTYTWYDQLNAPFASTAATQATVQGVGNHTFRVVVADAKGNAVEGQVVVSIEDNTPPEITAELLPVIIGNDHNGDGNGGNGSNDFSNDNNGDGSGNNGKGGKKGYQVSLSITDACDLSPELTSAYIFQPLASGDDFTVKFKKNKKKKEIKIQYKEKGTKVYLYGTDESELTALLQQAIDLGGFEVNNGDILALKNTGSDDDGDDDDGDDDDGDDDDNSGGSDNGNNGKSAVSNDQNGDGNGNNGKSDVSNDRNSGGNNTDDDKKDKQDKKDKDDASGSDNGNNGKSQVSNDQNGEGNGNNGKSDVSNDQNSGGKDDKKKKKKSSKMAVAQVPYGKYVYQFEDTDNGCKLTGASGSGIKLVAHGQDASGNTATAEAIPQPHPASKPVLSKPVVDVQASERVYEFGLDQNFPNPFNPATTIRYTLAEGTDVRLVVYNVLGQQVRELVNAAQAAGPYNVLWDGRDAIGRQVATGIYIYHLTAGEHMAVRKMIFTK